MDFFAAHSALLLIPLVVVPRITMLCMLAWGTLVSGSPLWWLGFILVPHLVVAVEACQSYWTTNPLLCAIAILVAFGGTGTEAKKAKEATNG